MASVSYTYVSILHLGNQFAIMVDLLNGPTILFLMQISLLQTIIQMRWYENMFGTLPTHYSSVQGKHLPWNKFSVIGI